MPTLVRVMIIKVTSTTTRVIAIITELQLCRIFIWYWAQRDVGLFTFHTTTPQGIYTFLVFTLFQLFNEYSVRRTRDRAFHHCTKQDKGRYLKVERSNVCLTRSSDRTASGGMSIYEFSWAIHTTFVTRCLLVYGQQYQWTRDKARTDYGVSAKGADVWTGIVRPASRTLYKLSRPPPYSQVGQSSRAQAIGRIRSSGRVALSWI